MKNDKTKEKGEKKRFSTWKNRAKKLRQFDKNLIFFLTKRRFIYLTKLMKLFTRIGDGYLWFILCIVFFIVDFYAGLSLSLASIIQLIFQVILKKIFSRRRPYINHQYISKVIDPPDEFSFPSGHTAAAFTVTFVIYFYFPMLFIPFLILSLLIGISRIYLGLHYPSDVIGGVLVGLISANIGIYLALLPIFDIFSFLTWK